MNKLEQYRALGKQYDQAVLELKAIQDAEDKKKREIHQILEKIKEAVK